jgi:CO dehydrogenase maturation factor
MGTMNKEQWLEGKIYAEAICECPRYDLLVMGRPEGEGCYCFANSLLRGVLKRLMRHYDYIVIDTEAGLEHFSRKTIDSADYIIIVTDMSRKGLATAKRIKELASELKLNFKKIFLIANRIASEDAERTIREFAKEEGLELLAVLPYDNSVAEVDLRGDPVSEIDKNSEVYRKMREVASLMLNLSAEAR